MPADKLRADDWCLEPEMANKINELRRYIGFGAAEEATLKEFCIVAEPGLSAIADHFYARIGQFPGAKAVLKNEEQNERLKRTLVVWMKELMGGPWDEQYCCRRLRIGQRHVQVGLESQYMFGAMSVVRDQLWQIGQRLEFQDVSGLWTALTKVTDFDLALITMSYMEVSELEVLRTLQDVMIQHLPVAVLCLDAGLHVTNATNIIEADSTIGTHVDGTLPADLASAVDMVSLVAQAHIEGEVLRFGDIRTDEGRHFQLTIVPVSHEQMHTLVHLQEVTSIIEAEARVAHAEALARVGTMAANVAHEIRNPLAAISASLQVISAGMPASDRRVDVLGKIDGQIGRLNQLVTDLLVYARPFEPDLSWVWTADAVTEAIGLAGVEVSVEGPNVELWADRTALLHVLVNLIQNASAVGSIVCVRSGPNWVEVEDNGPGVDPELGNQIFEPFVTTKAKGTGLGLAISQNLANGMGAELSLFEAPTRFRLSFKEAGIC
jgi:signal transduction histidine kinase